MRFLKACFVLAAVLLSGILLNNRFQDFLGLAESSVLNGRAVFVGPRVFDQYTVENLSRRPDFGSSFKVEKEVSQNEKFSSAIFSFKTRGQRVTGLINIPAQRDGPSPVVLLIRGYVDREKYQSGIGTKRVGEFFAMSGYLTLAPDFLGYGDSGSPSVEPLEERFQTYTTILDLYGLIRRLPPPPQPGPASAGESGTLTPEIAINTSKVYLWAHSNGGQIALTFLEITGAAIPTVLWAPVSKPFPYSILYYTDEAGDLGKSLRREIADFETYYDVKKYSLTEYLNRIRAPILLQQGIRDSAVPPSWSDELHKKLVILDKNINYEVYEGADHNLAGHWDEAVRKDLEFFEGQ